MGLRAGDSLRQSFLDGSLTRLLDPDAVLRTRIVDFVNDGEFGLASSDNDAEPAQQEEQIDSSTATGPGPLPPSDRETQVGLPMGTGRKSTLRIRGTVPPEVWNRLGTRILPKLRSGEDLSVGVEFSVSVDAGQAQGFQLDLIQALDDLGLSEQVRIEPS